jgi:DNA repair protein RecN (Recombination protein N)
MLYELRVENLLLMERAELRLTEGLNILTGETGAGKTLLAHALDLLLGGKARSGIVRPGAPEAYVEGVFSLPAGFDGSGERIPAGAEELVLARRVWPDGRTRAYVCGRAATVADLRELGGAMLAFYGQHEHRKLMLGTVQLDVLDAWCGSEQTELRARTRVEYEQVRELERRAEELRGLAGARERELDLLAFELSEIEAAAPSEDEAESLSLDRDRLRNIETLRAAAATGVSALAPDGGEAVCDAIARATYELEAAATLDASLGGVASRLDALRLEAEDVAGELRRYVIGLEGEGSGRLEQVEERLGVFARLERKHGGTIADVLEHAERCRERCAELEGADQALGAAEAELKTARKRLVALAEKLSERRAREGPELAAAVRERLAELAIADAEFEVRLSPREDGCGARGRDTVELLIAPNAGVPPAPLREIASGGELSRVMLALLGAAHGEPGSREAEQPVLVFDEIDAGIGGHTARAVGEQLRALAAGRQILCITHLPQVASLAQRHFRIAKHTEDGAARTEVEQLKGDAVVEELVRMLGADEGDRAARGHARELLKAA